jgi:hypothetical protein
MAPAAWVFRAEALPTPCSRATGSAGDATVTPRLPPVPRHLRRAMDAAVGQSHDLDGCTPLRMPRRSAASGPRPPVGPADDVPNAWRCRPAARGGLASIAASVHRSFGRLVLSRTHLPFNLTTSEKFVSTREPSGYGSLSPAGSFAPRRAAAHRWTARMSFDPTGPVSARPRRRSAVTGSSVARCPGGVGRHVRGGSIPPKWSGATCERWPGGLPRTLCSLPALTTHGLPRRPLRTCLLRDPAGGLVTRPRPCCACAQWLPWRGATLPVLRPYRAAGAPSRAEAHAGGSRASDGPAGQRPL